MTPLSPKKPIDVENAKKKYANLEFDYRHVCETIKTLRRTNMLGQQTLAEYLGYTRAAYSNNERADHSNFDLGKLLKIKKLFDITWSELLGEEELSSATAEVLLKVKNLEAKIKEKDAIIEDLKLRLADKDRIIDLIDTKARG